MTQNESLALIHNLMIAAARVNALIKSIHLSCETDEELNAFAPALARLGDAVDKLHQKRNELEDSLLSPGALQ